MLARDAEGQGIEDAVGARPIDFRLARDQQFTALGYPAQPTIFEPTFDGQRLYSCDSPVTGSDNPPGNGPETMEIVCDMSGGSSGGGWVNENGAVNGLISYGYELDFDHLYGPYFGIEAQRLYEEASGKRAAVRRDRRHQPGRLGPRRLQRRRRRRGLQGQGRRRPRPRLRGRRPRLRRRRRRQAEGRRRTPTSCAAATATTSSTAGPASTSASAGRAAIADRAASEKRQIP